METTLETISREILLTFEKEGMKVRALYKTAEAAACVARDTFEALARQTAADPDDADARENMAIAHREYQALLECAVALDRNWQTITFGTVAIETKRGEYRRIYDKRHGKPKTAA